MNNKSSNSNFGDLFIPYFLLNQHLYILSPNSNNYFNYLYFVDKRCWARFFAVSKIHVPTKLNILVDGAQFSLNADTWVVQYNLVHMLNDNRLSVYTTIHVGDYSLPSLSTVYKSCIWLERELSDFTNLNFLGLKDTRRLLLDYFEIKSNWQTHVNNDKNFNEALYDIMLSY